VYSELDKLSWTSNEETLYKVYSKIYDYNSCALAKIIRTKSCSQIRDYMKKYDLNFINQVLIHENLENNTTSNDMNHFDKCHNDQNNQAKRKKKKPKTKQSQSHFLARKLHEEAANNILNGKNKTHKNIYS
jgi:hypothetical protein